jgi:hypothetical protein
MPATNKNNNLRLIKNKRKNQNYSTINQYEFSSNAANNLKPLNLNESLMQETTKISHLSKILSKSRPNSELNSANKEIFKE